MRRCSHCAVEDRNEGRFSNRSVLPDMTKATHAHSSERLRWKRFGVFRSGEVPPHTNFEAPRPPASLFATSCCLLMPSAYTGTPVLSLRLPRQQISGQPSDFWALGREQLQFRFLTTKRWASRARHVSPHGLDALRFQQYPCRYRNHARACSMSVAFANSVLQPVNYVLR